MLAHEVPHNTSAEVMSQVGSYFSIVDNAVQVGDTNKRYTPTTNTCYGPPCPVQQGSYTNVVISPTADNTADIYNGYIYAEMKLDRLTIANTVDKNDVSNIDSPYRVWVGFKDAMDAIEKYEILANGITIYTQNNAIEESFITSCGMPEAKKRSDLYSHARHKDIFNGKFNGSSGIVVDLTSCKASDDVLQVNYNPNTIKLKIDLRRFLPISNIKYLPAFAGKIELRIYFSLAGLVVAPLSPIACFGNNYPLLSQYDIGKVTTHFKPWSEQFKMITSTTAVKTSKYIKLFDGDGNELTGQEEWSQEAENEIIQLIENHNNDIFDPIPQDASDEEKAVLQRKNSIMSYRLREVVDENGTLTAGLQRFNAAGFSIQRCETVIHCFGIDSNVYSSLVGRYSNVSLTFPTQTLAFMPMSNPLDNISKTSSQTITPRFVDSIFLLFPLKPNYRSVFINPQFHGLQIQCGGYGSIPDIACGTQLEPRIHEFLQNALNLNNDTVCLSKDVVCSLDYSVDTSAPPEGLVSNDVSNFLVGFPTETDSTFQQGQTSNTPITYTLNANFEKSDNWYMSSKPTVPIMGILVDSTFSIQVREAGAPPVVEIGAYDITSPVQ